MGFVLKYCDVCSRRVPEADLLSGAAVEYTNRTYCKEHVPDEARAAAQSGVGASIGRRRTGARVGHSGRTATVRPATPPPRTHAGTRQGTRDGMRGRSGTSSRTSTGKIRRHPSGVYEGVSVEVSTEARSSSGSRSGRESRLTSKKKSATPLVMGVIVVVLLGIVAAVVAVVLGSGPTSTPRHSGAPDPTRGQPTRENDTTEQNTSIVPNNGDRPVSPADIALQRWADRYSRAHAAVDDAPEADSVAATVEILAAQYPVVSELIRDGVEIGVTAQQMRAAETLKEDLCDSLAEAVWYRLRDVLLEYSSTLAYSEVFQLLDAVKNGEREESVPQIMLQNEGDFPFFTEEFGVAYETAKSDHEIFEALHDDTKQLVVQYEEIRAELDKALAPAGTGGSRSVPALKAFLDYFERLLERYPSANPKLLPRAGEAEEVTANPARRLSVDIAKVVDLYGMWLADPNGRAGQRGVGSEEEATEQFVDDVTAFLNMRICLLYLEASRREALERAIDAVRDALAAQDSGGGAGFDFDALVADVGTLEDDPDFDVAFALWDKLQLMGMLRVGDQSSYSSLADRIEAVLFAQIEAAHESGDMVQLTTMARPFAALLAPIEKYAEHRDQASEWMNESEVDSFAHYKELMRRALRQSRDSQSGARYAHISWGFPQVWFAFSVTNRWINEDSETRAQDRELIDLANSIFNRLVSSCRVDAANLVSQRNESGQAWILIQWIDRVLGILAQSLTSQNNRDAYDELQRRRATLDEFDATPPGVNNDDD